MEMTLRTEAGGELVLQAGGKHPRLERAFGVSAGRGMLDLLRYGVPEGAGPLMYWLRDRAHDLMVRYLRALRRGEDAQGVLSLPAGQLLRWLEGMPPVAGAGVSAPQLAEWFRSLHPAVEQLAEREQCSAEEWISRLGEGWQQLGLICFHLAENTGDQADRTPFAFLATFVHRVGADARPRHAPLGLAPTLLAADAAALPALLRPLRDLAGRSPFWAELINSRAIHQPCAWTARQAFQFLEEQGAVEECGIEVRVVNLWKTRPPRVELVVQVDCADGGKPDQSPSVNVHSLLCFRPQVALGDYRLSEEELAELLNSEEDGLVRFRNEWVRLDRDKLQHLLQSWRQATRMAAAGVPLLAGLRYLLARRSGALPQLPPPDDLTRPVMGPGLTEALEKLRNEPPPLSLPERLRTILRDYQLTGVQFLHRVTQGGFGACLADDMGLGKTLQVISWLSHLHATGVLDDGAALIVAPASLLSNWADELRKFAPQLRCRTLHPDSLSREDAGYFRNNPEWLLRGYHVALTTYGMVTRQELLARTAFPALVLDEAQAIKNAGSARTRAILRLQSPRRVALTGTPVENSLSDLHSLFQFLNPGLLGTEKDFQAFIRKQGTDFGPLRRLVAPFMLRRLKSDPSLLPELPPKTEQAAWCQLTAEQTRLYAHEVERMRALVAEPDPATRLALVLPVLGRLKQICNHPSHYLGEPFSDPLRSGKMQRLGHLVSQLAATGEPCLVFTQYRGMMEPLHDYLAGIYGCPGQVLHGGTPLGERSRMVTAFQSPGGPPFFILSLKAAGTGLTLTRACHVIHFDRWWNPAVENQASDRAYRIGQKNPVIIHPFICRGTIEQNIHDMLRRKSALAENLPAGGMEKLLVQLSAEELMKLAELSPGQSSGGA